MWFWIYNIALLVLSTSTLMIAMHSASTLRRQRRQEVMPLLHVLERSDSRDASPGSNALYLANRGSGAALGLSVAWSAPGQVLAAAVLYLPDVLAAGDELRLTQPYDGAALPDVKLTLRYAGIDGEHHAGQFDGERHRYDAMYRLPKLQTFGPAARELDRGTAPVDPGKV